MAIISAPYYQRTIYCPGHWLVNPKVDVYLREPIPELKDCTDRPVEYKGRRMKIKKMRIAKDAFGNKKIDWKKIYELKKKGQVIHPRVSASWAIEHIWDPQSLLCKTCKKWCKEGKGTINEVGINRLTGKSMSGRVLH